MSLYALIVSTLYEIIGKVKGELLPSPLIEVFHENFTPNDLS